MTRKQTSKRQPAEASDDLAFDDDGVTREAARDARPHATECVLNSECPFTDGCRGRLRQGAAVRIPDTSADDGTRKVVQVFCPKCGQFAEGHRPIGFAVATGSRRLFDRVKAE